MQAILQRCKCAAGALLACAVLAACAPALAATLGHPARGARQPVTQVPARAATTLAATTARDAAACAATTQQPAAQHPVTQHASAKHPVTQHASAKHPVTQHPSAKHPLAQHAMAPQRPAVHRAPARNSRAHQHAARHGTARHPAGRHSPAAQLAASRAPVRHPSSTHQSARPAPAHPAARATASHAAAPARPAAKRAAPPHPAAEWRIAIPSIGVTARLLTLGDPVGDVLPLPTLAQAQDAGWYGFTSVPGTAGNAVVVGHVDTYVGAGVFYDLYLLRRGDAIDVAAGGAEQCFKVTSIREVSKDQFPVNQVFGPTGKHLLWLITCGGDFDYLTGHYMDNIIVSAAWQPVNTRKTPAVCNNCHRQSGTFKRERNEANHCRAGRGCLRGGAGRGGHLERHGAGGTG